MPASTELQSSKSESVESSVSHPIVTTQPSDQPNSTEFGLSTNQETGNFDQTSQIQTEFNQSYSSVPASTELQTSKSESVESSVSHPIETTQSSDQPISTEFGFSTNQETRNFDQTSQMQTEFNDSYSSVPASTELQASKSESVESSVSHPIVTTQPSDQPNSTEFGLSTNQETGNFDQTSQMQTQFSESHWTSREFGEFGKQK